MRSPIARIILGLLLAAGSFIAIRSIAESTRVAAADTVQLGGLLAPARIVTDSNYIPHIFAANDHDAAFLLGYLHARDRFFQMDLLRRQASGTTAELLGKAALASDIQARTLGLRRGAEASLSAYGDDVQALLEAYAAGVNAWLASPGSTLPPEYQALELTKASVPAWTAVDSLAVAKALAFQLSFDDDTALTAALAAYQKAGQAGGFDGTALFFQDVERSAPFDPTVSIPGFFAAAGIAGERAIRARADRGLPRIAPETAALVERYQEKRRRAPLFENTLGERRMGIGSNWWIISGRLTESGAPMLASDPHLALTTPPIWYEAHLSVQNDPVRGPMNVAGVSLPGVPGIVLGCNDRACWGATVNPLDVTDTYQERLVVDLQTLTPRGTMFEDQVEPLVVIPQAYRVNQVGDKVADNLAPATVGPLEGGLTLIVPRRNNGPIVQVDISNPANITALSIQYTGWGATRELLAFQEFNRMASVDDFRHAIRSFTFGSQNFSYADVDGNIAYSTSAEMPLREDLQNLGRADGTPPYLVRDGTHHFQNEWLPVANPQPGQALPYEILPAEEMPHVVNPAQGYVVSANNDPVGVTLNNDPLGRKRPGGGVYYLSPGYASIRVGRITGLVRNMQLTGTKMSLGIMQSIQANHQMLDAEVFVPYIAAALANARAQGAPAMLAAMAKDAGIAEAVGRLAQWDFSTPTGIREGYDPAEDPNNLPEPSASDVQSSVAATVYSVWRGQALKNTIDAALGRLGLAQALPNGEQAMSALRNLLDNFAVRKGRGVSGVNFFQVDGAPTPEAARDVLLLRSVRDALDLLAGDAFASAFNRSTSQDDYRWGKLHRIVFRHVMGDPFNIPAAGGFLNFGPSLAGVARSGGFEVPDASSHSVRAAAPNGFMFGSGPSRRLVAEMSASGVRAAQIIPGGQCGRLGDPGYANMLGRWLTNAYHPLLLTQGDVEADVVTEQRFTP